MYPEELNEAVVISLVYWNVSDGLQIATDATGSIYYSCDQFA